MSDAEIKVGSQWRCRWDGGSRHEVESIVDNTVVLRDRRDLTVTKVFTQVMRDEYLPLDPPAATTPAHYDFAIQPIDAIRAWGLNFAMGNVVKYVVRADRKGTPLEDLEKARDYLADEIAERRKGGAA